MYYLVSDTSALVIERQNNAFASLVTGALSAVQTCKQMANAILTQQLWEVNQLQSRRGTRQSGSTVVTSLLTEQLLHIAHVGDCRIYLISHQGCQQLTDDVANYELGLAHITRNNQLPKGGHLTQALGVTSNASLEPKVQTFVLTEDCLELLCSDGLCDFNLLECHWRERLLHCSEQI
jgi:protein phosphatase